MRIRIAAAWLSLLWLVVHAQDRAPALLAEIDWSAVLKTWRIKGVLYCPKPCVWVENAYPVGVMEVTRRPFQTELAPLKDLAKESASHTASSDKSDSTLQYAEAHVAEFVPFVEFALIARPTGSPLAVRYLSELDRWAWRSPYLDWILHPAESAVLCEGASIPLPACAGRWGNYYPRHGFVTRDSEVIAAYLQALRAGRIASHPAMHVTLKPYPYEPRTGHYIQMTSPVRRPAVRIGEPDISSVEKGAGAKDGYYRFMHFGIFEACRGCIPTRLVEARSP
jgi:hypothetical protein